MAHTLRPQVAARSFRCSKNRRLLLARVGMYARLLWSRVVCLDIRGKCTHRYCAERESSRSLLLLLLLLFASSTAECTELLLPNNRFLIPPTLLSVGSFFSPLVSSRFLSCYIVRLFFYASPPSPRTFVLLIFLPTFLLFNIRSFHRFLFTFAITRACQVCVV